MTPLPLHPCAAPHCLRTIHESEALCFRHSHMVGTRLTARLRHERGLMLSDAVNLYAATLSEALAKVERIRLK